MCFQKVSRADTPKVAEQDITCYKYLMIKDEGLRSPFRYFIWKPEVLNTTELDPDNSYDEASRGFHSCKTVEDAVKYRKNWDDASCPIYEFTIPKGSLYMENYNQYISNQIIMKSSDPVKE